jgi:raffinose/stachyose/melibiose transport system permease protein
VNRFAEERSILLITYITLGMAVFFSLFPIALLLINSVKPASDVVQNPLALPQAIAWDNFTRAWADARFSRTLFNSVALTLMTICAVCASSSLFAYVLARQQTRYWQALTFYIMAGTTVPIQLFLFPLYFGFARLGLLNNIFAVAFVYTAMYSPLATMLLRTYFQAVPKELEESALVDGASYWDVFSKIMLPIVRPGVLTVALIVGLDSWNEFLISVTFLQFADRQTAVVSFYLLSGEYGSDWGEIMAAAVIIVLPFVALFIMLQRHFIEGMAGGSLKG